MFTGIIEKLGRVVSLLKEHDNLHIIVEVDFAGELKTDQSVAHNGVCLTVIDIKGNQYSVTAIKETLEKTNLGLLKIGDFINLERCMKLGDRMDGHMVQGHVDQTAVCKSVQETNGSWLYTFEYSPSPKNITVEKGSICVNGVSLTVVNAEPGKFSVAIIPYTHEHTNFKLIKSGDIVNLEFDILGKYIAAYMAER